ncbi:helix-turn-helix domain-containing protein [Haladaptatus sp. CMAA 1911]|uniref:helix-turn-helix domain-containing protein n=1 Tax=unclassified Haladaptatus TaxID=2622732 RepID=UPI0037546A60
MREFVFTVKYDRGIDPLTDRFIDHPSMLAKSLSCCVTERSMWRVDRITGPTEALSALESVYLDTDHCNECVGGSDCRSRRDYEILETNSGTRTIYAYRSEMEGCHSIPYYAVRLFGDGLLFQTTRRENEYRWRILMREDVAVGALYDRIQRNLRSGVRIELDQLGTTTRWHEPTITVADLPSAQREALIAAAEHGYYEMPRKTSVAEVAEDVGVPRSTLQYRLQRAESWLVTRFSDVLSF